MSSQDLRQESMDSLDISVISLLVISILNITWSTLFQKKIPWSVVKENRKTMGNLAFFYHTEHPGSVCWFGIFSGVLILIFGIVQLALVIYFLKKQDTTSLIILMYVSLGINLLITILMTLMNPGLLKNSSIYLLCQYVAICVVFIKTGVLSKP